MGHPHDDGDCWPSQCPICWRLEEEAEFEAAEREAAGEDGDDE